MADHERVREIAPNEDPYLLLALGEISVSHPIFQGSIKADGGTQQATTQETESHQVDG